MTPRDEWDEKAIELTMCWRDGPPMPGDAQLAQDIATALRSAAAEAIEECARVCCDVANNTIDASRIDGAWACADKIRALSAQDKEQPPHVAADSNTGKA